jgi:hypothetical protein
MQGLRRVYVGLCKVYAEFTQSLRKVYAEFTHGLRLVYARFTHGLRNIDGWFTQGLRRFTHKVGMFTQVYAEFTQSLRRVYTEFTWKAFPQPMCVNLRRASLRRVYAEFTQGQLADAVRQLVFARLLLFTRGLSRLCRSCVALFDG